MLGRVVCALVAVAPAQVVADGIAIVGGSPRAIGRAGAATVGDDGGGALIINPAAMARRDTPRAQLGMAAVEDSVFWQSSEAGAPRAPGEAGSRMVPIGAVLGALGPWIVGVGVMTTGVVARTLASPADAVGPLGAGDGYRYAGIAGSFRRDTLAVGAARRIGESIALGLSLAASRIRVTEQRRVWAGIAPRDTPGNPADDLDLELEATSGFAPSAVAGLLVAPDRWPVELGASIAWAPTVSLGGALAGISAGSSGPMVVRAASTPASLALHQPVALRAGVRYVGERVVAELDGDLWLAGAAAAAPTWRIGGVQLADAAAGEVALSQVGSRLAQRSRGAVRGSLDLAVIPGFLWATAGYAYTTATTPAGQLATSFAALAGHTVGLGIEAGTGGATLTLGWSRTWCTAVHAEAAEQHDNPFAAGDGVVPAGTYGGSLDQVGLLFELELGN